MNDDFTYEFDPGDMTWVNALNDQVLNRDHVFLNDVVSPVPIWRYCRRCIKLYLADKDEARINGLECLKYGLGFGTEYWRKQKSTWCWQDQDVGSFCYYLAKINYHLFIESKAGSLSYIKKSLELMELFRQKREGVNRYDLVFYKYMSFECECLRSIANALVQWSDNLGSVVKILMDFNLKTIVESTFNQGRYRVDFYYKAGKGLRGRLANIIHDDGFSIIAEKHACRQKISKDVCFVLDKLEGRGHIHQDAEFIRGLLKDSDHLDDSVTLPVTVEDDR